MEINSYFDKIYCLNLDKRVDKWKDCVKIFAKHGLEVQRFSGIDGSKLPIRSKISKGNIGCSLSHVAIFKDIIENGFCNALIFEDDVDFIDSLGVVFAEAIPHVPDWDMLYLGGTHMHKPTKVNKYFGSITKTFTTSHYAVTLEAAQMFIEPLEHLKKEVDVVISDFQPSMKSYVFMPSVAWQRPSISDIHGIYVDYTPFMKPK